MNFTVHLIVDKYRLYYFLTNINIMYMKIYILYSIYLVVLLYKYISMNIIKGRKNEHVKLEQNNVK